jgi:hypothetical protein
METGTKKVPTPCQSKTDLNADGELPKLGMLPPVIDGGTAMEDLLSREVDHASSHARSRHQLHCWLSAKDYEFLYTLARSEGETVTSILRRVIRSMRARHQAAINPLEQVAQANKQSSFPSGSSV